MSTRLAEPIDRERRLRDVGETLVAGVRRHSVEVSHTERWLNQLFQRLLGSEAFRVQALRFVDVLPMLDDDAQLIHHLQEYFSEGELPLPGIANWGLRKADSRWTRGLLARAARRAMDVIARRFMAGETSEEVLRTAETLREQGMNCSLDLLGEATLSEQEADRYCRQYLELFDRLSPQVARWSRKPLLDFSGEHPSPRLNVSLKATSLYSQVRAVDMEGSVEGIASRLRPLLHAARRHRAFVFLDMEQYEHRAVILEVFRKLLMEPELRDWPDAGIALQAYLKQTESDVTGLIEWAQERGTPVTVRLVRGAYWDYEYLLAHQQNWEVPVWTAKAETDIAYEQCLELLLQNHRHLHTAVATHNLRSISLAVALAEEYGCRPDGFEFQMLYGMAHGLRTALVEAGYRLRIYLPFGEVLPGMAYLVRRLLENTSSQSLAQLGFLEDPDPEPMLAPPILAVQPPEPESPAFINEPVHRFTDTSQRDAFAAAIEQVRSRLGEDCGLLIGGRTVRKKTWIESRNPVRPDEMVGRATCATERDADKAIDAAEKAFPAWAVTPMQERADCLLRAADLLAQKRDEFSAWEIFEAGKPWMEADADVAEAIDFLRYYAQQGLELVTSVRGDRPGETNRTSYYPRGVGVVIPPWNFPLAILTGMLAASVVSGNTVILKPSSQTPIVAAQLVALLQEAGMPKGVVNFITGPGSRIGSYLATHPRIHFVAFTGSRSVGTGLLREAAEVREGQRHIKRVVAEMGGKNAIIVDADADPDDSVSGTIASAFGYQGQKCSACSRVIVVGGHYDAFLQRLVAAAGSLAIGAPEHPGVFMGPVIEAAAQERILAAIDVGKEVAEAVLEVDCSHLAPGYFVGPTIFSDVPVDSALAQEEIFGPVLSVFRAADLDEAFAIANGTQYALTGGFYSRSPANLARAEREFQVGNLYLNRKITGALVGKQPFGGFRLSGTGPKAGGPDYVRQFVEARTVTENMMRKGYAPFSTPDV